MKVLGLSGSLRAAASNTALLRAAASIAPGEMTFEFYDQQIARLPAFNPDLDGEGATAPDEVAVLRAHIAAADGVFICTPEYAHGVPGAFKNALDWIVSSGEFTDKPTVIVVASPGGGQRVHATLVDTLQVMGARVVVNELIVFTRAALTATGGFASAALADKVRGFLDRLAEAIRGQPPA